MNLQSINQTAVLLQSVKTGELEVLKFKDLTKTLTQSIGDLDCGMSEILETEGFHLLQRVFKRGQSCFVVGPDGIGKSCAVILCRENDDVSDNLVVMPTCADTWELYTELWHKLGQPMTRIKRMGNGIFIIDKCSECSRQCVLPERDILGHYSNTKADETILVGNTTGKCVIKVRGVTNNIHRLENKLFLIRIPDVDVALLALLEQLLDIATVIIMANPEQVRELRTHNRFRRLPLSRFPKPTPAFFLELYMARLRESRVEVSPLTIEALQLCMVLAKFNPGAYSELLGSVFDDMEFGEITNSVGPEYVLDVLGTTVDLSTILRIVTSRELGRISATGVADIIHTNFGVEVDARVVGHELHALGYEEHKNSKAGGIHEYFITGGTPLQLRQGG